MAKHPKSLIRVNGLSGALLNVYVIELCAYTSLVKMSILIPKQIKK